MSFVAGQPRPGLGHTGALVPMPFQRGGRELVAAGGDSRGKQLMTSVGLFTFYVTYNSTSIYRDYTTIYIHIYSVYTYHIFAWKFTSRALRGPPPWKLPLCNCLVTTAQSTRPNSVPVGPPWRQAPTTGSSVSARLLLSWQHMLFSLVFALQRKCSLGG